jgi:type I restriction enzyme S subunit
MKLLKNPKLRDVDVPWARQLPEHWQVHQVKRHFRRLKETNAGMVCENRLALTMNGVVPRSIDDLEGLQSSDYEGYQIFEAGDLAFKLIDLQNVKTSRVGLVPERGIMSPAYVRLQPLSGISVRFAFWYFMALYWTQVFNGLGGGVRQTLGPEELLTLPLPIPTQEEQMAIAAFLDRETAKIDALVADQVRLLELLAEKRQAVIAHAVIKGLNPDAPIKDTGVAWLGELPAHWKVARLATLYREVNEPGSDDRPTLSVSIHNGVSDDEIDEADLERKITRSEDKGKYKRVEPNDLTYNMMRAWQGAFGSVTVSGQVSPAYVVARPKTTIETGFIEAQLRTPKAKEQIRRYSRGITDFRLRLYWDEFKELRVGVPPHNEQVEVLASIGQLNRQFDELKSLVELLIELLSERRSALIAAAVTGQIDVREAA